MSGLIRTVLSDGIEQADELEREAAVLDEIARRKRHTAAVLRTMTAVAATWNPQIGIEAGPVASSKSLRSEPVPTQHTGRSANGDRPALVLKPAG